MRIISWRHLLPSRRIGIGRLAGEHGAADELDAQPHWAALLVRLELDAVLARCPVEHVDLQRVGPFDEALLDRELVEAVNRVDIRVLGHGTLRAVEADRGDVVVGNELPPQNGRAPAAMSASSNVVRNVYVTSLGRSGGPSAVEIHCDRAGSFGQPVIGGHTAVTTAGRGLKCGSSLRATICQCGSGSPSFSPTPVLNSLIRTRRGICRVKRSAAVRRGLITLTTRSWPRFHPGRLVLAQADHLGRCRSPPPSATRTSTLPRKTCDRVAPDLSTSTPNSVPRSVTTAVGVRTEKRGEGRGERGLDDFGFRISDLCPLTL